MAAVAMILGGMAGFLAAIVALIVGLPLLGALGIWSLGGAACAALLLTRRPRDAGPRAARLAPDPARS